MDRFAFGIALGQDMPHHCRGTTHTMDSTMVPFGGTEVALLVASLQFQRSAGANTQASRLSAS